MKKNMHVADSAVRLIVAALMVLAFVMHWVEGTLGIILLVLAAVFTLTSFVRFCPLYTLFGISTCKVDKPVK